MRRWIVPVVLVLGSVSGAAAQKPVVDRTGGTEKVQEPVVRASDPRPTTEDIKRPTGLDRMPVDRTTTPYFPQPSSTSSASNSGRVWSEYARNTRRYDAALEGFRERHRDVRDNFNVQRWVEKVNSELAMRETDRIPPSDTLPPDSLPRDTTSIPPTLPPGTVPVHPSEYGWIGNSIWPNSRWICNQDGLMFGNYFWGIPTYRYMDWYSRARSYGQAYGRLSRVYSLGFGYGLDHSMYGNTCSGMFTGYSNFYDFFYDDGLSMAHTDQCALVKIETFDAGIREIRVALPSFAVRNAEMMERVLDDKRIRGEPIVVPVSAEESLEFAPSSVKRVTVKHCR